MQYFRYLLVQITKTVHQFVILFLWYCLTCFGLSYSPSLRGYVYNVATGAFLLECQLSVGQDGAEYEGLSEIFRTDAVKIINLTTKPMWKLPTSTQLRATWHNDSLDMVVLPSTGASRFHNCCIDGGTSTECFGYAFLCTQYISFLQQAYILFSDVTGFSWSYISEIVSSLTLIWEVF
jgi:hypothetical protein